MKVIKFSGASLLIAVSIAAIVFSGVPVQSKTWTVEQRQAKLMQDVNAGQKSGALTEKESKKLRKRLSNVARSKAKMTARQNGKKLTTADTANLQKRIDKASSEIKSEKGR
jgi:hypothetical protein